MRIRNIFLAIALLISMGSQAKDVKVGLLSDVPVTVTISVPIERFYNYGLFTSGQIELNLAPDSTTYFSVSVEEPTIIHCLFSTRRRYDLYLFPDSQLKLCLKDGKLHAEGENAKGNDYMNWDYQIDRIHERIYMDSVTVANCQDSILNFAGIMNGIRKRADASPLGDDIYNMQAKGLISENMANIMRKEFRINWSNSLISKLHSLKLGELLYAIRDKNYHLRYTITPDDLLSIEHAVDSIYRILPIGRDLLAHTQGWYYINGYGEELWRRMSKSEQDRLKGKYEDETFGLCVACLALPVELQPYLFGNHFVIQVAHNADEFNRVKMRQFMLDRYPESVFTSIVSEIMEKQNQTRKEPFVIDKPINSFRDLLQQERLIGKKAFVDLWATWCMPCRAEFQHADKLVELLNSEQINLVYLSLDEKDKENAWRKIIQNLNGVHLMATDQLLSEIKAKIYGGNVYTIPRYILLDPNGDIIDADLPRPSAINELRERLKRYR
ncbi:MAG: TlpA family protein disulfide reductase [Mediterranea sp.]|jgi:thiol-disulfide isomerase/thioredoxin|nr:TlpA family protein disulfide reductase [Mediterranea sp.]